MKCAELVDLIVSSRCLAAELVAGDVQNLKNCRPGSRETVPKRQFMIPTVDTTVVNQKCKFGTVGQIQDR